MFHWLEYTLSIVPKCYTLSIKCKRNIKSSTTKIYKLRNKQCDRITIGMYYKIIWYKIRFFVSAFCLSKRSLPLFAKIYRYWTLFVLIDCWKLRIIPSTVCIKCAWPMFELCAVYGLFCVESCVWKNIPLLCRYNISNKVSTVFVNKTTPNSNINIFSSHSNAYRNSRVVDVLAASCKSISVYLGT